MKLRAITINGKLKSKLMGKAEEIYRKFATYFMIIRTPIEYECASEQPLHEILKTTSMQIVDSRFVVGILVMCQFSRIQI